MLLLVVVVVVEHQHLCVCVCVCVVAALLRRLAAACCRVCGCSDVSRVAGRCSSAGHSSPWVGLASPWGCLVPVSPLMREPGCFFCFCSFRFVYVAAAVVAAAAAAAASSVGLRHFECLF